MSQPSSDSEVLVDSGELAQNPRMIPDQSAVGEAPARKRRVIVGMQPFSAYTVMLILALVFLTIASIILFTTAYRY